MLNRARGTLPAVKESAHAVTELANTATANLSELSAQVKGGLQIAPVIVAGIGVVAIVALVVALVAVSRA